MSEAQAKKQKPRWFTAYWIIIVALTVIAGIGLIFLRQTSLGMGIIFLIVALVSIVIAYYGRVKPSISLTRFMYILIGVPIGFILWYVFQLFSLNTFGPSVGEDFIFVFGSLAVCFLIGGFIGDLIGRLRHYKGPEQYQP